MQQTSHLNIQTHTIYGIGMDWDVYLPIHERLIFYGKSINQYTPWKLTDFETQNDAWVKF